MIFGSDINFSSDLDINYSDSSDGGVITKYVGVVNAGIC